MTAIDTHTPMPTIDLTCAQTHTHLGRASIALPGALSLHTHTHTHKQLSTGDLVDDDMHTHTHVHAWLLAQKTHVSFTFTGAFPLHACGVTRNLRTYFASVCDEPSLVGTVVLQTVLWDTWAWSARFLVFNYFKQNTLIDSS